MKADLKNRLATAASIASILVALASSVGYVVKQQLTLEKRFDSIESNEKIQANAIRVLTSEVDISQQKQELINRLLDNQEKQKREDIALKQTLIKKEQELLTTEKALPYTGFHGYNPQVMSDAPSAKPPEEPNETPLKPQI